MVDTASTGEEYGGSDDRAYGLALEMKRSLGRI
jgi:hypothetical protein